MCARVCLRWCFFVTEFPFQNQLTVTHQHKKPFKKISIPDGPNINGKCNAHVASISIQSKRFRTNVCLSSISILAQNATNLQDDKS